MPGRSQPSRVAALCQRFNTTHRDLFLPEVPAHQIRLPPFSIDRTEVTNADFKTFVERHPEWAPGRVPTELGLRFFVDSLLKVRQLSSKEQDELQIRYAFSSGEEICMNSIPRVEQ